MRCEVSRAKEERDYSFYPLYTDVLVETMRAIFLMNNYGRREAKLYKMELHVSYFFKRLDKNNQYRISQRRDLMRIENLEAKGSDIEDGFDE